MKKIVYNKDDIKILTESFKKLFPKTKHIQAIKRRGLVVIKFSITRWWIWRKLLPGLTSTVIPLYELLITQVPKQLSYRKVKNFTYSSLYSDQINFVANNTPEFMCKFLKEVVDKLPDLTEMTFSDVLEETQSIAKKDSKDGKSLLERIKIFDSFDESTIISQLISRAFQNKV